MDTKAKTTTKVLIICGYTATGKTGLALQLAREFGGELISADSRQIYQGMDIGTGKDIPPGSQFYQSELTADSLTLGYYDMEGIKLWGCDFVPPEEPFSSAQFARLARTIITTRPANVLPIIVGGTGYYMESLVDPPDTMTIPPDEDLRQRLNEQPVEVLQAKLQSEDPKRFAQMNRSDRQNPRRLIRAIEVSQAANVELPKPPNFDTFWIGLHIPFSELETRIRKRVIERIEAGMTQEVTELASESFWASEAATATGYREWYAYLQGEISREEAIREWTQAEVQYAKRQRTWFQKREEIQWFNPTSPQTQASIVARVKTWYA